MMGETDNKVHELKIEQKYFKAIEEGVKTFEIRLNDRDYRIGDTLLLKEILDNQYTGKQMKVLVTYTTTYAQVDNYLVMSIIKL